MASPDFSPYIDLSGDNLGPDELYTQAVQYARLALPEFAPRTGTVEDAIMQATSLLASLTLGAINSLPDGLMEGILRLMGITRFEATFGTINVEFEMIDVNQSIASDFYVIYESTEGEVFAEYPFYTTEIVTAGAGLDTITATLTASVAGILPSIPIGTELIIAQPNGSVLLCTTTSLLLQGNQPETDEEYFSRATSKLQLLNSTLVTAAQVEAYILTTYDEVHRCKVYDLTKAVTYINPSTDNTTASGSTVTVTTTGTQGTAFFADADFSSGLFRIINNSTTNADIVGTPTGCFVPASPNSGAGTFAYTNVATHSASPVSVVDMAPFEIDTAVDTPGYFVVFICDENGNPISSDLKTTIYDDVKSRIVAGLSFQVLDPIVVDVSFTVSIKVNSEYASGSVATNVGTALESYVSPENWPNWETTIRYYDLVVEAVKTLGVSGVTGIVSSVPSYVLSTVAPGNALLVSELTSGSETTGYEILYMGVLPRATVEIVVE
jgi:hypothetical protein